MSAARDEAIDALLVAIKVVAEESKEYSGTTASEMVRDAALAFRFVVGGAQPGGVVVNGAS